MVKYGINVDVIIADIEVGEEAKNLFCREITGNKLIPDTKKESANGKNRRRQKTIRKSKK